MSRAINVESAQNPARALYSDLCVHNHNYPVFTIIIDRIKTVTE